jgi:hypothetical protein
MTRTCRIIAALLVLFAGATLARAQTPPHTQFEITPFIGYQFGGDFIDRWSDDDTIDADIDESSNYGLMVNIGVIEGFQIELMYSRQDTELEQTRRLPEVLPSPDITVEYYHFGGLYQWRFDKVVPYVAGSLGATRFDPEFLDSETKFSWSAGGGVKLMFNPHVGLRLDGRFFSTYIESNEEVYYSDYWDDYYRYDDKTFLHQWNAKAGIVFAF